MIIVDVYWRRAPRLAVKTAGDPKELDYESPCPDREEDFDSNDDEWGWRLTPPPTDTELANVVGLRYLSPPRLGRCGPEPEL